MHILASGLLFIIYYFIISFIFFFYQTEKFFFTICLFNCEHAHHTSRDESSVRQEERELAQLVESSLRPAVLFHTFPKSVVDVRVCVLCADGGVGAAAVTATSSALAAAGVPLHDAVAACVVAKVDSTLLIDPTHSEERRQRGGVTISYMPNQKKMTQFFLFGELSHTEISKVCFF